VISDDEARLQFFDGPQRREAAHCVLGEQHARLFGEQQQYRRHAHRAQTAWLARPHTCRFGRVTMTERAVEDGSVAQTNGRGHRSNKLEDYFRQFFTTTIADIPANQSTFVPSIPKSGQARLLSSGFICPLPRSLSLQTIPNTVPTGPGLPGLVRGALVRSSTPQIILSPSHLTVQLFRMAHLFLGRGQ